LNVEYFISNVIIKQESKTFSITRENIQKLRVQMNQNLVRYLPLGALFLAISLFIKLKYLYLIFDQYEQIPLVFRALNPAYLMNDWYVNANSGISVRFFYTMFVSGFVQFISLQDTMFLLFVVSIFATGFLVYYIAMELFDNPVIGVLSSILMLFAPDISLGGNVGVMFYTIPQTICFPIVLLGFLLFLKNKRIEAFIVLGAATYLEPLWGIQGALILLIIVGLRDLIEIVPLTIVYSVVSAPVLVISAYVSHLNSPEIISTILIRHPHHYLPFRFPIRAWIIFVSFCILFLIALWFARDRKTIVPQIFAIVIFFCTLGTIFVEIFPVSTVIKLQLFKATLFVVVFGIIYVSNMIVKLLALPKISVPKRIVIIVLIAAFGLGSIAVLSTNREPVLSGNTVMYQWIGANTQEDAIFLIPPNMQDFRVKANRGVVFDLKPFPFRDEAILEYRERADDVTNNRFYLPLTVTQTDDGYRSLTELQIVKIANKYNATYAISFAQGKYQLNQVYSDEKYCIYRM